jgi:hypothetical protein
LSVTSKILSDPFERANLTLSAGAIATSFAIASSGFTASLAVGAVLEVANFRALRRAKQRLFAGEIQGGWAWSALFGVRFAALGVAMYVVLRSGADPIALVLGLSLIVPATLWVAWRTPPPALPATRPQDVPPPDDPSWDDWNPWLASERRVKSTDDDAAREFRVVADREESA